MPDATEPVGAGRLQGLQDRSYFLTQIKVGMSHDGGGSLGFSVETGCGSGGHALDELNLTHRTHLFRAVGTVHGVSLDEHRGAHVMAAVQVSVQLGKQIILVGNPFGAAVPQMVVRVADGNLGLQGRLFG